MKYIVKILRNSLFQLIAAMLVLVSCNKDVEQFTETPVTPPSGKALGETIAATATDSLYYRLISRAGLVATITNTAATFTMFVPDTNAMTVFLT